MDYTGYVTELCQGAKTASRRIAGTPSADKNRLLRAIARSLREERAAIISRNALDIEAGKKNGLSPALLDRLLLNDARIEAMARSIDEIAAFPDPIGRIEGMRVMESGIRVGQMRVPLGVVAVIYESRPNVTTDIAALCIKSGNASILRGGSEAINSNTALHSVIADAIRAEGFDPRIVSFVAETDRNIVPILLKQKKFIDIVIPRGGEGLISMVTELSAIPVIKHDRGLCHLYIDDSAEATMAQNIALNGKVQRPGVCNALETILVHGDYPHTPGLIDQLITHGVEVRACERVRALDPVRIKEATAADWDTEYLDLIVSIKIVDSLDEAMEHIARHGSGHSEVIVTSNYRNAERFLREVDSAAVMVNASSRFHDGGEFGLGAEVGISTEKLHARGAMGVDGLTTLKYIVYGQGEVRKG